MSRAVRPRCSSATRVLTSLALVVCCCGAAARPACRNDVYGSVDWVRVLPSIVVVRRNTALFRFTISNNIRARAYGRVVHIPLMGVVVVSIDGHRTAIAHENGIRFEKSVTTMLAALSTGRHAIRVSFNYGFAAWFTACITTPGDYSITSWDYNP